MQNGRNLIAVMLTSGYLILVIVGLLNNYIFIIIKHMILYIFYFKYSVIRLYRHGAGLLVNY